MRKYIWLLVLFVIGLILIISSIRTKAIEPSALTEVRGQISDHTFVSARRSLEQDHYFWLRGMQCTFSIPSLDALSIPEELYTRSFQDTTEFIVRIKAEDLGSLNQNGKLVKVVSLRTGNKLIYENRVRSITYFEPALVFSGLSFLIVTVVMLLVYLIRELMD